ncbi:MAG: SpoIIE family protein phosphatase [Ignavibacteriae bacterium]|nr:SpoIIE family protein phosphatase [Ignavibacteriota bacterium]MCB9216794.1 SpoIIE family protein phosphatase [Ignavibacteria bacterium]
MVSTLVEQSQRILSKTSMLRVLYTLSAVAVLTLIAVWTNALFISGVHSDDCLWDVVERNGENILIVKMIFPGGAAEKAGVLEGDRVLEINGNSIPPAPAQNVLWYAQSLLNNAPTDRPIPYVIERGGMPIKLQITLSAIQNIPLIPIIYAVFATLWLLIGLIVGLTRPTGSVQRLFFLTGLTVFFGFSGPAGKLATTEWRMLWIVGSVLYTLAWIHFCGSFPVRQDFFDRKKRRLFIVGTILLPALVTLFFFLNIETYANIISIAIGVLSILNSIYFGLGVWLLFRGYGKMPPQSDKRPMRAILVGTMITALVLLFVGVIGMVQMQVTGIWQQLIVIPAALFVALPLSYGYAIFRYQLMDVRAVVKTTLVYTLTTGAIVGLYITLALRLGQELGSLLGEQMQKVVSVAILVLFLLAFEPIRRSVQRLVDRRFFPQYRDYSEHLAEYGARVTEAIGVPQVAGLIAGTLSEQLALQAICVSVMNVDGLLEPVREVCGENLAFAPEGTEYLQGMLRSSHDLTRLNAIQQPELRSIVDPGFAYTIGLYAGGRLIGAILLGKRSDGKPISGSQISFINSIASQGASGIEAARLYEREIERRRYEEELATARRIQQSLLPSTMPQMPGVAVAAVSRPAMAVGGDYYEVIPLSSNRLLVMIADVSGKGLPASLYMAELHGMVRIVSSIRQSPHEMLTLLNAQLCGVIERGTFITASIGLIDLNDGTFTLARAGHMRLIRQRGGEIETFEPAGLPLGIRSVDLFNASLEEITLEYQPGDRFILYSDGISEAMNEGHEEYGEDRLYNVLRDATNASPEEVNNRLLQEITTFRGEAEQNDDVTVVVVEMGERN